MLHTAAANGARGRGELQRDWRRPLRAAPPARGSARARRQPLETSTARETDRDRSALRRRLAETKRQRRRRTPRASSRHPPPSSTLRFARSVAELEHSRAGFDRKSSSRCRTGSTRFLQTWKSPARDRARSDGARRAPGAPAATVDAIAVQVGAGRRAGAETPTQHHRTAANSRAETSYGQPRKVA